MNHEQTLAWWEKQAPAYFTDKAFSFSCPDLISSLGVHSETRVLEIGFGYGRELSQFCRLSDHVYGVELFQCTIDLAMRELCKQDVTVEPNLQTYDGKTLPFEDGSFDLVYSCFVLQHMSRAAAKEMIRESVRVLADGGHALMEFFGDPEYYHPTNDCFSGDPNDGGMFNNAYMPGDIHTLIADIGEAVWIESRPITKVFSNYWLCLRRKPQ